MPEWKDGIEGLPNIETALSNEEARELLKCVEGKHVVLEIGSAQGFSTVLLAEPQRKIQRLVLAVDPHTHYDSWDVFRGNLEKYSATGRVLPFKARDTEIMSHMTENSVDMAFIDGDHSYEACLYDLLQCLRIVRPGGLIALHDYTPLRVQTGNDGNNPIGEVGFPGVRRAVDEHLSHYPNFLTGTLYVAHV